MLCDNFVLSRLLQPECELFGIASFQSISVATLDWRKSSVSCWLQRIGYFVIAFRFGLTIRLNFLCPSLSFWTSMRVSFQLNYHLASIRRIHSNS